MPSRNRHRRRRPRRRRSSATSTSTDLSVLTIHGSGLQSLAAPIWRRLPRRRSTALQSHRDSLHRSARHFQHHSTWFLSPSASLVTPAEGRTSSPLTWSLPEPASGALALVAGCCTASCCPHAPEDFLPLAAGSESRRAIRLRLNPRSLTLRTLTRRFPPLPSLRLFSLTLPARRSAIEYRGTPPLSGVCAASHRNFSRPCHAPHRHRRCRAPHSPPT